MTYRIVLWLALALIFIVASTRALKSRRKP